MCEMYEMRPRYIQVLDLAKIGKANKEIASELHVSERRVGKYIEGIMQELEAHNRIHSVYLALEQGIIGFDGKREQ